MTHLGADVAAFVDGQLPADRELAARRHLAACTRCRQLVAEQEHLKRRMARSVPAGIPDHLATALAAMDVGRGAEAEAGPGHRRSVATVVALMGSSAAVLLMAYLLAPAVPVEGDPVRPQFDRYAADFLADTVADRQSGTAMVAVSTSTRSSNPRGPVGGLTETELDRLVADGWPCHRTLSGDLQRVEGHLVDADGTLAVSYEGEHVDVHLAVQVGSLDRRALEGFEREELEGSVVWVRPGLPTVATWEAGGIVYTVVTDGSAARLAAIVAELPTTPARSTVQRIEDGLHRMTGWVAAA